MFGCACLVGGLKTSTPKFNPVAANSNTVLLLISIMGISIPTLLNSLESDKNFTDADQLLLSRIISCIMIVLYVLYVYFQLHTHRNLFDGDTPADRLNYCIVCLR